MNTIKCNAICELQKKFLALKVKLSFFEVLKRTRVTSECNLLQKDKKRG